MAHENRTARSVRGLSATLLGFALVVSLTLGATGVALASGTHPDGGGVALAAAQSQESQLTICDRDAATFVDVYNDQSENIPGLITGRVKESQIHLQVVGSGGGNYTLDTNAESQVTDYSEGKPADGNLRIETDCETFRNITDSANPGSTFRTAYRNGEVRIIGLGAVNWLFFEAVKTLTDPVSLVVILFFVLLIVGYVVYRRFAIYYRERDDEEPVEPVDAEGASDGSAPGDPTDGDGAPGPADGAGAGPGDHD